MNYFLEALVKLPFSNFKVIMVGQIKTKDQMQIKDFLKKQDLLEKVILPGFQKDIPSILDALDLFVHPSIEEADPWVYFRSDGQS